MTLLYFPLFLKILFSLTGLERVFKKAPAYLGRLEYFISPWRDTLLSYVLLILSLIHFFNHSANASSIFFLLCFFVSGFNRFCRLAMRKKLCRWLLQVDAVEPNQFFEIYHRSLGSFRNQIPATIEKVNYSSADYRTGKKSKQSLIPILKGALDTATLAKLSMVAMKQMPGEEGVRVFDHLARIWGGRLAADAHALLKTEVPSPLPPPLEGGGTGEGKVLLVFNHKSYFDFAFSFFALGKILNNGRHLKPRFITAKDHFIDNPLIYSWMGLGKCIEKAGMIFINRKKGKGWQAMQEAADKLCHSNVEVAVYPQGTRAWGLKDAEGQRIDAGYYTTFNQKTLSDLRGHLKKGTAQLILDTALRLREMGEAPLKVLFIGIDGTATSGPKGSFLIQTESEIVFRVSTCWEVKLPQETLFKNPQGYVAQDEAEENYLAELKSIQAQLDREMQKSIHHHSLLMERVLKDPRILLNTEQGLNLSAFLKRADEIEHILPFVVLDRLYALPTFRWEVYLQQFAQLALRNAETESWQELNTKISRELIAK